MRKMLVMIAIFLLSGVPVAGARVHCSDLAYRQLDFWLGNWSTYDDAGKGPSIARDQVTSILGGCVILERYRQNDGHSGDGVTIYDASRHVWHQTWVTNRGELLVLEGRFKENVLTMHGHNLDKKGKPVWYRVTWKKQGKGVRETAYISRDDGKSWMLDFDLLFLKRH